MFFYIWSILSVFWNAENDIQAENWVYDFAIELEGYLQFQPTEMEEE